MAEPRFDPTSQFERTCNREWEGPTGLHLACDLWAGHHGHHKAKLGRAWHTGPVNDEPRDHPPRQPDAAESAPPVPED